MGFKLEGIEQAEAWSASTILGPGWHEVTIEEVDDSTKTRNGYDQFELRLANVDGDIRDWIVITEATLGKLVQLLEAAGIEQSGDLDSTAVCKALTGKRVRIKVGEEPSYNDPTKMRRRVQAYTPPESSTPATPAAADDADLPF